MAKLKGPLFSLGASQKLGNALVYFGWKGLNVVREYVIPSNPQTSGQTTQRGYVTAAVAAIHAAQAHATQPLAEGDVMAYSLWASVVKAATTWFNQAVKNWLDQKVASLIPVIYHSINIVAVAGGLQVKGYMTEESSAVVNGNLHYGTSKTALINTKACAKVQLSGTITITGLTKGVKYFVQYRPTGPAGFVGSNSGIYYGTPT